MDKQKLYKSLKTVAYFVGFPLMSLMTFIMFIPMFGEKFMGNHAVNWIIVTLAIWAVMAIIHYVTNIFLSKKSANIHSVGNVCVILLSVIAILVPGTIYGAVQQNKYDAIVSEAKSNGVELKDFNTLMGWYNTLTKDEFGKKKDSIYDNLYQDVDQFMRDYGVEQWKTELLGTSADSAMNIGVRNGVLDTISNELKRKELAKAKLDELLAKRAEVEKKHAPFLQETKDALEAAQKRFDEEKPMANFRAELYKRANTIIGSTLSKIKSSYLKVNNVEKVVNDAITNAKALLGESAELTQEDNEVKVIFENSFNKITSYLTQLHELETNWMEDLDNEKIVEQIETCGNAFLEEATALYNGLNANGIFLKSTITAENAQAILNKALTAKVYTDANYANFKATYYKIYNADGDSENKSNLNFYKDKTYELYNAAKVVPKEINEQLIAATKAYNEKYDTIKADFYPYDGYPTSITLVQNVYSATYPLVNEKVLSMADGTKKTIYTLKKELTAYSKYPITHAVYEVKEETFETKFGKKTYTTYTQTGTVTVDTVLTRSFPIVDVLCNALNINLTKIEAEKKFELSENSLQILEMALGAIPGMEGLKDVLTIDNLSLVADKLYNAVSNNMDKINEMLSGTENGALIKTILPSILDAWNRYSVYSADENGVPDKFAGLLLTVVYVFDTEIGLGTLAVGMLPETLDIVIGDGAIAKAQKDYDSGYTETQLLKLQYELENYPTLLAYANFKHITMIFAGIVVLSLMAYMFFAKKEKEAILLKA